MAVIPAGHTALFPAEQAIVFVQGGRDVVKVVKVLKSQRVDLIDFN